MTLSLHRLLLLLIVVFPSFLFSQDGEVLSHRRLTVFTNFSFDWEPEEYQSRYQSAAIPTIRSEHALGYLSIAYSEVLPKGRVHGAELARFGMRRKVYTTPYVLDSLQSGFLRANETEIHLAVRYFYSLPLFDAFGKNDSWQIRMTGAVRPFIHKTNIRPANSLSYPTTRTAFGADLQFIPGIDKDLKGPWHIEFDIPIDLARIEWESDVVENPRIPERNRRTTTINSMLLPSHFNLRVGLGYAF